MKIKINFLNDLVKIYKENIVAFGGDIEAIESLNDEQTILAYLNILNRTFRSSQRIIKKSKDFTVPEGFEDGYTQLNNHIIKGQNINKFLSKSILALRNEIKITQEKISKVGNQFNDLMLNDWGIYHFHLGNHDHDDGFCERTDPLLYAMVTNSCVYQIGIFNHGKWADIDLLNIVNDNWPELLAKYNIENLGFDPKSLNCQITENDQVRKFRNFGGNVFVTLKDGTTIAPVGGGICCDGISDFVNTYIIYIRQEIVRIEKLCKKKITNFLEKNDKISNQQLSEIVANLSIEKSGVSIYSSAIKYKSEIKIRPELIDYFKMVEAFL